MTQIRIGNAPCSWGTLEFEGLEGESIGYAQLLDELAQTGYQGTELGDWGYMPTDPEALQAELTKRDLTLLGAFVPVALKDPAAHEAGVANALKTARLLSEVMRRTGSDTAPFLVLADDNGSDPARTGHAGRITPQMGLSDSDWKTFCDGANRIASEVNQSAGLRTVFHHHCAGQVETPEEIQRLLDGTNPELLGLVFDTGHYLYGAGQHSSEALVEGLNRFAERIWYVHLKDCHREIAEQCRQDECDYFQAVRSGVFCELGKGCVDFQAVKEWLANRRYQGWVLVEQDVLPGMGRPKESAQRNRDYLRAIGL